uniref:Family with sequence similarity 114 member A2 n=1 Tax=Callorhinchus milii TaxID=7868 RepID=A0A4W3H830_CALMI
MENTGTTEVSDHKEIRQEDRSISDETDTGRDQPHGVELTPRSDMAKQDANSDKTVVSEPELTESTSGDSAGERREAVSMTRKRPESKAPTQPVGTEQQLLGEADKESSSQAAGSWGYWGNWGKSLLSTATATVASVGHGISQAIEKAETSLGIPSPTEVSAEVKLFDGKGAEFDEAESSPKAQSESSSPTSGAFGMFSTITSAVQSTGITVLSGGLDALEFIGKKTMDVLAEGDPGFKKTKGLMNRNTTLSQALREAKEREELLVADQVSEDTEKKAHYGMLFDEFQGLSHLEALEILSNESEGKVKSVLHALSGQDVENLKEELEAIKEAFSLVEFDEEEEEEDNGGDGSEFVKELCELLSELNIATTSDKLSKARKNAHDRITEASNVLSAQPEESEPEKGQGPRDEAKSGDLNKVQKYSVEVCAQCGISCVHSLAELTARSIEQFHKVAELILHSQDPDVEALDRAKTLSKVTVVLCKEVASLSKQFTSCLTALGATEKVEVLNPLITGVFLEASNSATYIQDAFQLLVPVLQVSQIQSRSNTTTR